MIPEDMVREIGDQQNRLSNLERMQIWRPKLSTLNVSSPPTDAELDAEFGTAHADGQMFIIDDNGAGTAVWLVVWINSGWWYEGLTKAT